MKIKALTLCPVLWSNMWHVITGSPATMHMKITNPVSFLSDALDTMQTVQVLRIVRLKPYENNIGTQLANRFVPSKVPFPEIETSGSLLIPIFGWWNCCVYVRAVTQRYKGNLTAVAKKTRNARSYIYTSGQLYSPATLLKIKVPKWGFCRNATEDAFDVPQRTLEQNFF